MATIHANTQLKTGDTVNGLSSLKDCESGRGINLRLDGKAVVPEEWAAPCSPPTISGGNHKIVSLYYAEYDGYAGTPYLSKTFFEKYIFPNDETRVRVLQSIIPNKFSNIMNDWPHPGVRQNFDGTKSFRSELPNGQGYYIYSVVQSTTYLPKPSVAAWPPYIDSELIYDAASGRFKPACAQHDPYLPENLKNERRCLSLCDTEGNCVIIRRTERGIELWQEKYKQRALIDPATGKVLGMEQDNGTAKLELTSLTDATLPVNRRRTIIGVGETVKVTANQIVEWEIRGGLLHKEHKTATTLIFTADDQEGSIKVIARTDCDEENITFSVIQPKGLMVIRREIIHAQNVLDAGFIANFYLLPNSVNFYRVQVREVDSPAHATGSRINSHGTFHGNYPGGYSPWLDSSYHMKEDGNILSGNDLVYSFLAYFCMRNIQQGEVHYNIPYEWRLKPNGKIYLLTILQQSTITDKNGYTTTRKGLVEITFKFSEPNKNIDIINNQLGGIPRFKSSCP